MDKKEFAAWYIIGFSLLTYYLWQNNDSLASIIAGDGYRGIFWYFLSNPAYILLVLSIFYFNREAGYIRNTIGSVLIVLSSDIISFPRLSSTSIGTDTFLLASPDGLVAHEFLKMGFSYSTFHITYYLIFPIVITLISLKILGLKNFVKTLQGGG